MNATLVDTQKSTVEPVASHVDPSWKGLYRVGGVCLLLAGLIFQKTKHLDLSQHCFDGTDHGTHSL